MRCKAYEQKKRCLYAYVIFIFKNKLSQRQIPVFEGRNFRKWDLHVRTKICIQPGPYKLRKKFHFGGNIFFSLWIFHFYVHIFSIRHCTWFILISLNRFCCFRKQLFIRDRRRPAFLASGHHQQYRPNKTHTSLANGLERMVLMFWADNR